MQTSTPSERVAHPFVPVLVCTCPALGVSFVSVLVCRSGHGHVAPCIVLYRQCLAFVPRRGQRECRVPSEGCRVVCLDAQHLGPCRTSRAGRVLYCATKNCAPQPPPQPPLTVPTRRVASVTAAAERQVDGMKRVWHARHETVRETMEHCQEPGRTLVVSGARLGSREQYCTSVMSTERYTPRAATLAHPARKPIAFVNCPSLLFAAWMFGFDGCWTL